MASHRTVTVGGLKIGGGAPISIQSMCNADPADAAAVTDQVLLLAESGCDLVRMAVPSLDHVRTAVEVRNSTRGIPLVADVHFDHRVAVALCGIVDKIRINPGTLRGHDALAATAAALRETGTPVRIGTNSGSLPPRNENSPFDPAERLVFEAGETASRLMDLGVENIVLSMKSSSPVTTIRAYELAAARFDFPLHVGVTESGTVGSGGLRTATVLGSLLSRGIGDTVRVSLAGNPVHEVTAAKTILSSLGLREPGIQVRACPTCGRARIDTAELAEAVESAICERSAAGLRNAPNIVIAVMGCEVNGPGEAAEAAWAIVGTANGTALYRNGSVIFRGSRSEALSTLICGLSSRIPGETEDRN